MADAVLFTHPDPRVGLAATDLFKVKGIEAIIVTTDGVEWQYHGPLSVGMRQKPGAETGIVLCRGDDVPIDLASVPKAIAAAVVDHGAGWIFWFGDGQAVRVDRCTGIAAARSEIEARCLPPGGYELPSQKACAGLVNPTP